MRWFERVGVGIAIGILVLSLGLLLFGCPKPPSPPPITPPDAPAATCEAACDNLRALACHGAEACADVCPRVLDPAFRACIAAALTCDAVSACDK
ncbi:MAG: hypothetical protein V4537_14250 [Pseudomonadota bacterium]